MGKVEKTGVNKEFQNRVRDMLQPRTVLQSSLSKDAEAELQETLHGGATATA